MNFEDSDIMTMRELHELMAKHDKTLKRMTDALMLAEAKKPKRPVPNRGTIVDGLLRGMVELENARLAA